MNFYFLALLSLFVLPAAFAQTPTFDIKRLKDYGVGGISANIYSVPNQSKILLGFGSYNVVAFNLQTQERIWEQTLVDSSLLGMADYIVGTVSANGKFFAVGGHAGKAKDPLLEIRSVEGGAKIRDLQNPVALDQSLGTKKFDITSMRFSFDQKFLIANSNSHRKIFLWNAESGALIRTFDKTDNYGFDIGFSPDQKLIYQISAYRDVQIWSAESGALVRTIDPRPLGIGQGYVIYNGVLSDDMRFAAFVGCYTPGVFPDNRPCEFETVVFNLESGKTVREFPMKSQPFGLRFFDHGLKVLTISEREVDTFDILSGKHLGTSSQWTDWRDHAFNTIFGAPRTIAGDEQSNYLVTPNGSLATVWQLN